MATRGSFCPVAENKNAQRKLFVILSEPNDGLVTLSLFMYIIKQSIITSGTYKHAKTASMLHGCLN